MVPLQMVLQFLICSIHVLLRLASTTQYLGVYEPLPTTKSTESVSTESINEGPADKEDRFITILAEHPVTQCRHKTLPNYCQWMVGGEQPTPRRIYYLVVAIVSRRRRRRRQRNDRPTTRSPFFFFYSAMIFYL